MEKEEATGGKERSEENKEKAAEMSSKEKRKAMKKMKRKQMRKEIAEKERKEAEAKLNDPAEQERLRAMEDEEARLRDEELKKFEESERAWREAMEMKRKKEEEEEAKREEEERRWKDLEESRKLEASRNDECGEDEDGEYEYIEEGPPEIIFQGNEIILRKNKVRVPKKSRVEVEGNEISDRPTSNPLPPRTEDFTNYQNVRSAQQILENVAQEVPNFGTEQDKSHCPFHLKTGACRFGPRCSRVHFYPDKSCTLLMKNMYNGPGIAWEQDEGLEYTEEEAERCYEEFYEDVHTEFLKYGELVNFKVCRNGSFHLKGNVYVHYRSLESAILAYQSINGRYFAGKQVKCEFVNISRWKVAICGEYMKSRLKTCSRGSACNFIHCFRNPGGDYEWADHDKPPPRFWIHKMAALFGYSDEYLKSMEREYSRTYNDSRADLPTDSYRQHSRRSKTRDHDHVNVGSKPSYRSHKNHGDTREHSHGRKLSTHEKYHNDRRESPSSSTRDGSLDRDKDSWYVKDTSCHETKWSEHSPRYQMTRKRIHDDSSDGSDDDSGDMSYKQRNSRRYGRKSSDSEVQEQVDEEKDTRTRFSCSNRNSRRYNMEQSATDQEESCERSQREGSKNRHERSSSRNSYVEFSEKDCTENKHKRSDLQDQEKETSPGEYQSDKDKNGHRYRSQDRDSGRSRRSSKNGVSVEEPRELNGTETRRNVSGSSEESSDRETHKERPRRRKRRRRSRHSPEEIVKFCEDDEGEIERWRPV